MVNLRSHMRTMKIRYGQRTVYEETCPHGWSRNERFSFGNECKPRTLTGSERSSRENTSAHPIPGDLSSRDARGVLWRHCLATYYLVYIRKKTCASRPRPNLPKTPTKSEEVTSICLSFHCIPGTRSIPGTYMPFCVGVYIHTYLVYTCISVLST